MKKKLELQQAVEIMRFINTFGEIAEIDKDIIGNWLHANTEIYEPPRKRVDMSEYLEAEARADAYDYED